MKSFRSLYLQTAHTLMGFLVILVRPFEGRPVVCGHKNGFRLVKNQQGISSRGQCFVFFCLCAHMGVDACALKIKMCQCVFELTKVEMLLCCGMKRTESHETVAFVVKF